MNNNIINRNSDLDERDWDYYWAAKNKKSNLFYDNIAVFYRKYIIKSVLDSFIKKTFAPGAVLLHAGCGGGQVDSDVVSYARVTALDISQRALDRYQMVNGSRAQIIKGSIFKIPLPDNSVDGVYNLGVMEHFTEAEISGVLKEFYRILKPGGQVLLFWPPEFGLSVLFMKIAHFILNNILKKNTKLHPDEVTRIYSQAHARRMFEAGGFLLSGYYFGIKDLFTHAIVRGKKIHEP